jgi:hypothetical protein
MYQDEFRQGERQRGTQRANRQEYPILHPQEQQQMCSYFTFNELETFKPHLLGFNVVVGSRVASTAAQELCLGFVEA